MSGGVKPSATDCLAVLRAAVGIGSCDVCVCDTSGNRDVKATDALQCLQNAVGQPVELNCPPCGAPLEE